MKKIDTARALRDEDYFLSLSEAERAAIGDHPSGPVELHCEELRQATGAAITRVGSTILCTQCGNQQCGA
jgi:mersacidin/lichenicidin family type 2 lantibiotic